MNTALLIFVDSVFPSFCILLLANDKEAKVGINKLDRSVKLQKG